MPRRQSLEIAQLANKAQMNIQLAILCFATSLLALTLVANTHSCPDERPYQRGRDACDSCPAQLKLAHYKSGALSTTRTSALLNHKVRVSVVCDTKRTIDVDDVFKQIGATERVFVELFEPTIDPEDGNGRILEVITGICDYGNGVDDCVMYAVCTDIVAGGGCDVSSGQSFANADSAATHIAFIPWLPADDHWWVPSNRYGNLHHEFAHLLDYTYIRVDEQRKPDIDWWVEGMPQYIQWQILDDRLSWDRGNDEARLLDIFKHRANTRDYYDGMRVVAFLDGYAPSLLQAAARSIRAGVYRDAISHATWLKLLETTATRYQEPYERFVETVGAVYFEDDER